MDVVLCTPHRKPVEPQNILRFISLHSFIPFLFPLSSTVVLDHLRAPISTSDKPRGSVLRGLGRPNLCLSPLLSFLIVYPDVQEPPGGSQNLSI